MVTPGDFIHLAFSPDLTLTGITYTCKTLVNFPHPWVKPNPSNLRQGVGQIVVELAFRRYLDKQKIPHRSMMPTPFTAPDHYDLTIGGRRCIIRNYMLTRRSQIKHTHKDPTALLQIPAMITSRHFLSDSWNDDDLLMFTFLNGLVTPNLQSLKRAIHADQPFFLIHTLPQKWAKPAQWRGLGKLTITNNCKQETTLKLGGQDVHRLYQTEEIKIPPREKNLVESDFFTLNYIQAISLPDKKLDIHSPTNEITYTILPQEWWNIWIYGSKITLAGFITGKGFREQASPLPAGSSIFQESRTKLDTMSVPVSTLHPLIELFERAQSW